MVMKITRKELKKLIAEHARLLMEQEQGEVVIPPPPSIDQALSQAPTRVQKAAAGVQTVAQLNQQKPAQADAGAAQGVAGMTDDSNINDLNPEALADALFSGVPNDLYTSIATSTKWAAGALAKRNAATPEGMRALALQAFGPDEATARKNFVERVRNINAALAASEGFAKDEMPALEGSDLDELQDALSPGGKFQVDVGEDFKQGERDFNAWYGKHGAAEQAAIDAAGSTVAPDTAPSDTAPGQATPSGYEAAASVPPAQLGAMTVAQQQQPQQAMAQPMQERWARLAGLSTLNEINQDPRFPFPGPVTTMQGAPTFKADVDIDEDQITGKARSFLTKGLGTKGDTFKITAGQGLANSAMKPTQTNIKAGKSILFALNDSGLDMGGAYATTDGDILDGHHRWSGQHLRTGGDAQHTGINLIDKGSMGTKEFLTMLTVVGNALGRPTKLK